MSKRLLPLLGGMVLAAVVVVAGLLAFILPPDVLEPTLEEQVAEQETAQADAEGESEGEDNLGEADPPREGTGGTQTPDQEAAEDAPGGGDGQTPDLDAGSGSDEGGQDTGEVAQNEQDLQDTEGTDEGVGSAEQSPGA